MRYTATRKFVFRSYQFEPGDLFDTDAVQCDPHRARVLMNQRYIEPGYNGENATLSGKKSKTVSTQAPAANEPEQANSAEEQPEAGNEPENEPESNENSEPEAEAPKKQSKRRS